MTKFALPLGGVLTALLLFPAPGRSQTVSIVSGNGQLVCLACPINGGSFVPLTVSVVSSSGSPMANTSVKWTASAGEGSTPTTSTTVTNASGIASYTFVPFFPFPGVNFIQSTVTAVVGTSSVQFIETAAVPTGQTGLPSITVTLVAPISPQPLTGTAGATGSSPIKVQVSGIQGLNGGGLAGIALQLISTGGASVACATQAGQPFGVVLTTSTGLATCTPVFGKTLGTGSYTIAVGVNYAKYFPASVTVTNGPPALIKLISGNTQTVNAGSLAPLPLTAEVEDLGGNGAAGGHVSWAVQGNGTLTDTVTTSPAGGIVSTRVTVGSGGSITVTASLTGTTSSITFTINIRTNVSQFDVVSGNGQSTQINTAFAPLIVQVNDNGAPLANVTVSFTVTSGSATLGAANVTTNTAGQATETVTAGPTAGAIVITAAIAGSSVSPLVFDLTSSTGPVLTAFTNAAGYQKEFISPCSLATIFGSGLATGIQGVVGSFLEPPYLLAGVSVTFSNIPAPILDVANENGQESVTVQVPCEVTPGAVPVVVTVDGGSTPTTVNVLEYSPGIFQTVGSDGTTRAVLVRPDGSFVSLSNPAHLGEVIRMYVTGIGQTNPPLSTGQLYDPLVNDEPEDLDVTAQMVVGVNNAGVVVLSAKYLQGTLGVYEVDFQVPQNTTTTNNAPFAIAVYVPTPNGLSLVFGNPSLIPIQP
jgi:uncharacterized protein (TIGR03437 family)